MFLSLNNKSAQIKSIKAEAKLKIRAKPLNKHLVWFKPHVYITSMTLIALYEPEYVYNNFIPK